MNKELARANGLYYHSDEGKADGLRLAEECFRVFGLGVVFDTPKIIRAASKHPPLGLVTSKIASRVTDMGSGIGTLLRHRQKEDQAGVAVRVMDVPARSGGPTRFMFTTFVAAPTETPTQAEIPMAPPEHHEDRVVAALDRIHEDLQLVLRALGALAATTGSMV